MNDAKIYENFQKAIFEGIQEGDRLDAIPQESHIPYGRCRRHPEQVISNGMFDSTCPLCEEAMEYGE